MKTILTTTFCLCFQLCFSQTNQVHFAGSKTIGQVSYGFGLSVSDLDKDGHKDDIVVSDLGSDGISPSIRWYRFNKLTGSFEESVIFSAENLLKEAWLEYNYAADIDNDEYTDIIVVSNNKPRSVFWLKNPGEPNWGKKWRILPITHVVNKDLVTNQPTRRPYVVTVVPNKFNQEYVDVVVGPAADVINGIGQPTDIEIMENPRTNYEVTWKRKALGFSFCNRISMLQPFFGRKVGMPLLFVTSLSEDYSYVLYEEDNKWKWRFVDGTTRVPGHGDIANLDNDGNLDFVVAAGYRSEDENKPENRCRAEGDRASKGTTNLLMWYELQETIDPNMFVSKQSIIRRGLNSAFVAKAGILRKTGRDDVVVANAYSQGQLPRSSIWICVNPETAESREKEWPIVTLKVDLPTVSFIEIADVDDDTDNDIIALAVGLRNGSVSIYPGAVLFFENLLVD